MSHYTYGLFLLMLFSVVANQYSPRTLKDIVLRRIYDVEGRREVPKYNSVKEIVEVLDKCEYKDDPIDYVSNPTTIQYIIETQKIPYIGDCDDFALYFAYSASRLDNISDSKILMVQFINDIFLNGHSVAIYRENNEWWMYDYGIEGPFESIIDIVDFIRVDKYSGRHYALYIVHDIEYPSTHPVMYRYYYNKFWLFMWFKNV